VVGNLLILAGLLVLAYPAATWGYTWWQQRELGQRLERAHPRLADSAAGFFASALSVEEGRTTNVSRGTEARERADLRKQAEEFAAQLRNETGPIGRILIPGIGVDAVLMEGTGRKDLREGPGHWPETPLPGMGGNFVVSGHRSTYGAPFRKLDDLAPGDEIQVLLPYAALRYRVTRSMIVKPDDVQVVAPGGQEEIFLATCHPIYSARERLVVRGELAAFELLDD
jgi:sortase A